MHKPYFLYLTPLFIFLMVFAVSSCGVYSFTGASVEGKTINFLTLENKARNVVPSLTVSLTNQIRNRILAQTGLSPLNNNEADYIVSGYVTAYDVTVTGVQNTQTASMNRLTISVNIDFKNNKNPKSSFQQSFTRYADFSANQALSSVESRLIEEIGRQLADDIFNKAFVNW